MTFASTPLRRTASFTGTLLWPLLALLAILLYNLLFTRGFFDIEIHDGRLYGSVIDILRNGSPVMLLALGMTLVIATGGVDLSVGAVMAIAGAVLAQLLTNNVPAPLAITAALTVALAAGIWNGLLVTLLGIQPIVATLVLMVAGRGIAQLIARGRVIEFSSPAVDFLWKGSTAGLPFPFLLVIFILLTLWLATRRTAAGLFIEAVGNNATAARFAGVSERAVKILVYAISGFCAGLAGLIAAANISAADPNTAGLTLELDAILAVVIGGTALAGGRFYLLGSIVGALIIQAMTTTILTQAFRVELSLVVKAIVVIAVCLLQSEKFLARLGLGRRSA